MMGGGRVPTLASFTRVGTVDVQAGQIALDRLHAWKA